jgi:outer membrane protein assembly factor BamB
VPLKRGKCPICRILLLIVMFLVIGLVGFGCVQGLQSIGWSGGAVSDGVLFVGSKEGRLVVVDLADESRQWAEPLKESAQTSGLFGCSPAYGGGCGGGSSGVAIYGTPAIAGEFVYIAGYSGKVYAYTKDTLAMRWVYPREGYLDPIVGGVVVDQEKIFFGGSDGNVYALDAVTGDKIWEFPTGDKIWSTPAVSDGTVYIGSFDKKLHALNAADGSKKWEFEAEGSIVSTPLVNNGTVYIGSFDRHLYAVDTTTGKQIWQFPATEDDENKPENWFWAKPVLYDDTIYAACLDDKVYALQAATGDKVTEFDLGSPVSSAPVVDNGTIIFTSRDGIVYAVGTVSNEVKQLAEIEEEVYGPLCINDGVVYIHTQDLTLHRINATTGAVLRSVSLKSSE